MFVHKVVSLAFGLYVLFPVALTASLPAGLSPLTSTSSLLAQVNSSLPMNLTLLNSSINDLPEDPFYYNIPRTDLILKLYAFAPRLSLQPTYATLQIAVHDVLMHIWADPDGGNIPMPAKTSGYIYRTGGVRLLLRPREEMTWAMWGNTLRGLRLFGEIWEFVGLEFEVWDGGEGGSEEAVGSGNLWEW